MREFRATVARIEEPASLDEVQAALSKAAREDRAVSVCGGRHAMGGQQFGADTVLLDTGKLNKVLKFDRENRLITAQAGIQWPELLEWLLAATARSRAAVDLLTFVYRDPGVFGDDRAYLVRRGTVRACFPYPTTPIERIAFGAVVNEELGREEPAAGPLPLEAIDELLLLMSWFRMHPDALKRTVRLEEWEV